MYQVKVAKRSCLFLPFACTILRQALKITKKCPADNEQPIRGTAPIWLLYYCTSTREIASAFKPHPRSLSLTATVYPHL